MRSATPFFDSALYRKTMARFWPLWAGWTLLLTFLVPVQLVGRYFDALHQNHAVQAMADYAANLPQMVYVMGILQLVLCALCAMAAFSYLYNNRSAFMMHALPMRREKLFGTQYLSGISMVVLPELAVSVLVVVLELALLPSEHWGTALSALGCWLLAVLAQAVTFYSIAVFCAMFTGHILALPVFYGVVNFLVTAVYGLLQQLCHLFLYGFSAAGLSDSWVTKLTPALAIFDASRWVENWKGGVRISSQFASPGTLGAYVVVGLILTVLALFIYRRRHVESAGDVVAVPLVRPLFRWSVALCSGLFLGAFCGSLLNFGNPRLFLCIMVVLWTLVGYVAAEMMLKKSFHVLRGCRKGAAAATALSILLCAGCYFDWMGVETRLPALDQVVSIDGTVNMGVPWDSGRDLILGENTNTQSVREKVLKLHQAVVADLEKNGRPDEAETMGNDYIAVDLSYQLKNGRTLSRRYHLPIYQEDLKKEGTVSFAVQQFLSDRELAGLAYNFDQYEGSEISLMAVELDYVKTDRDTNGSLMLEELTGAQRSELWKAVRQDFDAGNIGVRWAIDSDKERLANTYRTDLKFYFRTVGEPPHDAEVGSTAYTNSGEVYDWGATITLTPQASHTLGLLQEYGVWDQCELIPWD